MKRVIGICCVVIIFVISLTLVIFVPKKHVFHDIKTYYPELLSHFQPAQIDLINEEINPENWESVEDDILLNKKASYKKIPLYDDHKYLVDIKKHPQTVNIISQIHGLKGAFLGKLGPKTILKVRKNDKKFMRVQIPLQPGFETTDYCGVWVKRDIRCMYKNMMYDTSNIFSMYNKLRDPIKFIVLEMEWPNSLKPPKIDKAVYAQINDSPPVPQ